MRKDQRNAYVGGGGTDCPYCGRGVGESSMTILGGSMVTNRGMHSDTSLPNEPVLDVTRGFVRWRCLGCNKAWDEIHEVDDDSPQAAIVVDVRGVNGESEA